MSAYSIKDFVDSSMGCLTLFSAKIKCWFLGGKRLLLNTVFEWDSD